MAALQTADTPIADALAAYVNRPPRAASLPPHLRRLEAEAIEIMREVVAQCRNPVLLYSIGKDSTAMLHLARKAFFPVPPPLPFLHIATTWDFRDMIAYRDIMAHLLGIDLRVHTNADGLRRGIDPINSGAAMHAQVMSTEALKQALDQGGFDAALGGARRDEEKSRAKERVFSLRNDQHAWDPRRQRPELWNLYNASVAPGESMRVFPLSNWTELDVWTYLRAERVPVVPLYFAAIRPVVRRQGALIVADDERLTLAPGEAAAPMLVRFRTLGCYPLTAATHSAAADMDEVIAELQASPFSERQGRLIDHDAAASMERKKREGYF